MCRFPITTFATFGSCGLVDERFGESMFKGEADAMLAMLAMLCRQAVRFT